MLERAEFPEQVGVDSKCFVEALNYLDSIKMRLDSVMVLRKGKVACECHWNPNTSQTPHDMYSLSKTITATAIGIAVDEGIISLDTKIYPTYFPEKLAKLKNEQRKWAEMVTIHHVISMRMGKVTSVFDDKETCDWIDGILDCPIQFEPGTDWKYISENAFLLSWILQKETGMTMNEFLTPRLYEPLDIKVPDWEVNNEGVNAGGWGLKLTADDMAKIAILYLNHGVYNGKRIFSESWYELSTHPHTKKDEIYTVFTEKSEYGYQIWIDHENNDTTLRFIGLYCQLVFLFPEYDAAIIVTASDNRDDECIHSLYRAFPKGFIEPQDKADNKALKDYKRVCSNREILPDFKHPVKRNRKKEKEISGRLIKLLSHKNLSTQGATTFFMWRKKIGSLNDIKFEFDDKSLAFSYKEKDSERTVLNVGMNGEYIENEIVLGENKLTVCAQGAWNKDGSLEIFQYSVGRPQRRTLTFKFVGDTVVLSSKTTPGFGDLAIFNMQFNMGLNVGPKFKSLIHLCAPVFEKFYSDPSAIGIFTDI